MKIAEPSLKEIQQLRLLWQEAFGDEDAFLDCFFRSGFSPERCRCILEGDTVAAVLYWFGCSCGNQRLAYIYGVATRKDYRGQGLCRTLMADTHTHLAKLGYDGAVLVPQQEPLRQMYAAMGYRSCGGLDVLSCNAGKPVSVRAIGPEEFAQLRRQYLPEGGVVQEEENLAFLQEQAQFYAGDDFLLTAWEDKGILHGLELLGNRDAAPGIVGALGCREGSFRMPGNTRPFAMFLPFCADGTAPSYFGFAFD